MTAATERLHEAAVLARARAESFRWLADHEPYRRTLTQGECHILAREADVFAAMFEEAEADV